MKYFVAMKKHIKQEKKWKRAKLKKQLEELRDSY